MRPDALGVAAEKPHKWSGFIVKRQVVTLDNGTAWRITRVFDTDQMVRNE
jgi:hypothetical protein